jgi:hypothetical protein
MQRGIGSKHPQTEDAEDSDLQYPREYMYTKLRKYINGAKP